MTADTSFRKAFLLVGGLVVSQATLADGATRIVTTGDEREHQRRE